MRKCLACSTAFTSPDPRCPACDWSPKIREGFPEYAPSFAQEGGGFKATYFTELARLEAGHFWFRIRNHLIIWAIKKHCPGLQSFLEIGCGTGYVLSGIAKAYPLIQLSGSEIFTAGLAFAAARQPKIDFMQMDGRNIPFVEEFDAIGAFDVLEHIEEDQQVLTQINGALKQRGIMLLTVPQHEWLWSPVDEYACHVRRYSAIELHAKVTAAGFEILRSTSFVSSLLPAMYASRWIQKLFQAKNLDPSAELRISPWLNYMFEKILNTEVALIRGGVNLHMGGSRLIVARKL